MNLIQLLILFSVMQIAFGCQSRPEIRKLPLCFISLELDFDEEYDATIDQMERFKYATLIGDKDGQKIAKRAIFDRLGYCSCREFDYMSGEFSGLTKGYPLSYCSTLVGSSRKEVLEEVIPWVKASKIYYDDMKKKASEQIGNKYK